MEIRIEYRGTAGNPAYLETWRTPTTKTWDHCRVGFSYDAEKSAYSLRVESDVSEECHRKDLLVHECTGETEGYKHYNDRDLAKYGEYQDWLLETVCYIAVDDRIYWVGEDETEDEFYRKNSPVVYCDYSGY